MTIGITGIRSEILAMGLIPQQAAYMFRETVGYVTRYTQILIILLPQPAKTVGSAHTAARAITFIGAATVNG